MPKGNRQFGPEREANARRKMVEEMAGVGVAEADIARAIGTNVTFLRKDYGFELETAAVRATTAIAQSLYRKALGDGPGAVTAAIFWLKVRGKWVEPIAQQALPGKKELAAQVAETAVSGTDWHDDLAVGGGEARVN